jgi:hypothetical protein
MIQVPEGRPGLSRESGRDETSSAGLPKIYDAHEVEKLTSARTTQTEGAPFLASFARSGRHTVKHQAAQKMTPSPTRELLHPR